MKKPLIIEPEAERDIVGAYEWYEQQRPVLGTILFCALRLHFTQSASALARFPGFEEMPVVC
jgi:hypothetical protein